MTDLSATAIRNALAAGEEVSDQVPAETAVFLAETHAYGPPLRSGEGAIDAYAVRLACLASLYPVRAWAAQAVDFRRLLRVVGQEDGISVSEAARRLLVSLLPLRLHPGAHPRAHSRTHPCAFHIELGTDRCSQWEFYEHHGR